MKKFLKYITIIGCILILAGAGIATIAFSLGGEPFRVMANLGKRFDQHENRFEAQAESVAFEIAEEVLGQVEQEFAEAAEYEIKRESVEVTEAVAEELPTFELVYEAVTDLEIQIEGGEVRVESDVKSDVVTVIGVAGNTDHVHYKNVDRYQKLEVAAKKNEEYVIIIPADWRLSDLEVDCAGGRFEGDELRANETEFCVSGGKLSVLQNGGKNTSIECTGGSVDWTGAGEISRNIDVECTGGKVNLTLDNGVDSEKVGYDFEYTAGEIDFFGNTYTGVGSQRKNAEDGMPHLELEVAGGKISVK